MSYVYGHEVAQLARSAALRQSAGLLCQNLSFGVARNISPKSSSLSRYILQLQMTLGYDVAA